MIGTFFLALALLALPLRAELFVCGFNDHTVRRYSDTNGAYLGLFATNGLSLPHEVIFGPDNHLYVASAGNDRVLRFNGQTGGFVDAFVTNASGGLDYSVGIAFGPDGNFYVASQLNDRVLRYHGITGQFMDIFVTNQSGGLDGPSGLTFGPDSNLYVVGRYSDRAYCYNGTNGAFIRLAASNELSQPFGLDFGPDGNLYVASGNSNNIVRFNAANGASMGVFTLGGGLALPIDLAFGPDTNLYVASYGNDKVARFNGQTGAFIDDFATGSLDGPNFLTFRPAPASPQPGALFFRANTNSIDYGHELAIPIGFGEGEFTLEIWTRLDTTFPIGADQVTDWYDGDPQPYSSGGWWFSGNFLLDGHNNNSFQDGTFSLQFYGGGRLRWDFGDGANAGPGGHWAVQAWPATNAPSLLDGLWHHVACVRRWANVSEALLELWVDGNFIAAETSNVRTDLQAEYWTHWTGFPPGQEGWFWGSEKQAAIGLLSQYEDFKGMLDEVRYWNYAKGRATLSNNWNSVVQGSETGLVGWINFRERAGSLSRDALDPVRTIALSNSVAWTHQNAPFDIDADGLPDWWEARYSFIATNDPDGDGPDNAAEFESGTDPTDASDHFSLLSITNGALSWSSVGGRRYRVEFADAVTGAFESIVRAWSNESEQGVGLDLPSTETAAIGTTNGMHVFRVRRVIEAP